MHKVSRTAMRDFVCGVTRTELLGCSRNAMEGGQAFVRMDKLETDESKRRNLGGMIVFKDAIQSTLPNLRCWLVSPCNFGIIRVRSPADLVSLGLTLEPERWKDSCTRKRSHLTKTHPLRAQSGAPSGNRNGSTATCLMGFQQRKHGMAV